MNATLSKDNWDISSNILDRINDINIFIHYNFTMVLSIAVILGVISIGALVITTYINNKKDYSEIILAVFDKERFETITLKYIALAPDKMFLRRTAYLHRIRLSASKLKYCVFTETFGFILKDQKLNQILIPARVCVPYFKYKNIKKIISDPLYDCFYIIKFRGESFTFIEGNIKGRENATPPHSLVQKFALYRYFEAKNTTRELYPILSEITDKSKPSAPTLS